MYVYINITMNKKKLCSSYETHFMVSDLCSGLDPREELFQNGDPGKTELAIPGVANASKYSHT